MKQNFVRKLVQGEYRDVNVRNFAPNPCEPIHKHEFGASVLVLKGEITITMEDRSVICRAGNVFALNANVPHAEQVGDEGVRFLACRK